MKIAERSPDSASDEGLPFHSGSQGGGRDGVQREREIGRPAAGRRIVASSRRTFCDAARATTVNPFSSGNTSKQRRVARASIGQRSAAKDADNFVDRAGRSAQFLFSRCTRSVAPAGPGDRNEMKSTHRVLPNRAILASANFHPLRGRPLSDED